MSIPRFKIDLASQPLVDSIMQTNCFKDQIQLEMEALEFLVWAHGQLTLGRQFGSYKESTNTWRQVTSEFINRMTSLGLTQGNPAAESTALADYYKDPDAYLHKLITSGVFTSMENLSEQALIVISWAWVELSQGKELGSYFGSPPTFRRIDSPLERRMKRRGLIGQPN